MGSKTHALGQNFLKDNNIVNKIIRNADISKNDNVIEIGPGEAALSRKLADISKKLTLIEI